LEVDPKYLDQKTTLYYMPIQSHLTSVQRNVTETI